VSTEQQNEQGSAESPKGNSTLAIGAEVRVSRLNTLKHVRAELARLYREARKREGRYPDALTATRLATILGAVGTSIEVAELERRIRELEDGRGLDGIPRITPRAFRAA
jgi:hypothetical protein